MEKKITETMWAICSKDVGLYCGTHLTRKGAIKNHCEDTGKDWKYHKKKGDRAVKVTMTYSLNKQSL